jgi:peptide/nickel transport system permease protein
MSRRDRGLALRLSGSLLLLMGVAAVMAPLIAPQNPFDIASLHLFDSLSPPAILAGSLMPFPLGSDGQGRDILSAILYGARLSFMTGCLAVLLAAAIGVPIGLVAGFAGHLVDIIVMRLADAQLAIPALLLALLADGVARVVLPRSWLESAAIPILVAAIGLARWPHFARLVRTGTQLQRRRDYVSSARLSGLNSFDIVLDHVLPNITGPVLVMLSISMGLAVMDEATLSFLGVGLPPTRPSLGTLIRIGSDYLLSGEWWVVVFPILALAVPLVLANIFADALRSRFDSGERAVGGVGA